MFGNTDPASRPPYFGIVKKGIIEAARQANANLQPARIGFGTGKAYINTNRDEKIGGSPSGGWRNKGRGTIPGLQLCIKDGAQRPTGYFKPVLLVRML
jgi:hypothetical protein